MLDKIERMGDVKYIKKRYSALPKVAATNLYYDEAEKLKEFLISKGVNAFVREVEDPEDIREKRCERGMIDADINAYLTQPKCPMCGTMNISPISTGQRTMSVLGLGMFSKKINKSFQCNNSKCNYTW
jgi:phage FluMu protein Com